MSEVRTTNPFLSHSGDPPFYLKRQSSSESNRELELEAFPRDRTAYYSRDRPGLLRATTNGSSADDFRSVIDDLTVENKRLRARLRQLEAAQGSNMEDEKLFEVKVHGLSADKRRELEEKLQAFAASIHSSGGTQSTRQSSVQRPYPNPGHDSVHASSSTSNSRRVDSAYASISTSEAKPFSSSKVGALERALAPSRTSRQRHIRSFLQDIPEGLFPRYSPVLTEKAKQKLVVKRLEQLFTGRHSPHTNGHGHSLQQQEISNSAARADREESEGVGKATPPEGLREAQMLPVEMEVGKLSRKDSLIQPDISQVATLMEDSNSSSLEGVEQRPTRPLDLDPDRAQTSTENINYIRHLGISTAETPDPDPQDAPADAEGWVYLNLLINMAQLHIINVTPDFVRSAISNLSSKLQLSPDGSKIRWRGGTEGTQLSSESGADSGPNGSSPNDSDDLDGHSSKRRKVCPSPRQEIARGHALQSERHPVSLTIPLKPSTERSSQFYYKPLFKHHHSSQESTSNEDSISPPSYHLRDDSATGKASQSNRPGHTSVPGSSRKKTRRTVAPMIFYDGAPFYVDLSGDLGDNSTETPSTQMEDGGPNGEVCAVGCDGGGPARPIQPRTASGSKLEFRPFKDHLRYAELSGSAPRPRSPSDHVGEDGMDDDIHFSPQWSSDFPKQKASLQHLDATGLGGTRPADHFAVTVETRRAKLDSGASTTLSRFSAPSRKTRNFLHRVSKSSLRAVKTANDNSATDAITSRLAMLNSGSSSSASSCPSPDERLNPTELPVKTEVVATRLHHLEPSDLPPPAFYFPPFSDSEDSEDASDSDFSESDIDVPTLRRRPAREFDLHIPSPEQRDMPMELGIDNRQSSGRHEDNEGDDQDKTKMLVGPEDIEPQMSIGDSEHEAQRNLVDELPIGSSAATVGGGRGVSGGTDSAVGSPQ